MKILKEEAIKIIKEKLHNHNIPCSGRKEHAGMTDITNDNFLIEISSHGYHSFCDKYEDWNYTICDIAITTTEYPHLRRAVRKFDLSSGNFIKLIEKVREIIEADKVIKANKSRAKNQTEENRKILETQLKDFNPEKQYDTDLILKTPYFTIEFYPNEKGINIRLDDIRALTVETAIELYKKLK
jgi:hypothetical protein